MNRRVFYLGLALVGAFAAGGCQRVETIRVKRAPMIGLQGVQTGLPDKIETRTMDPSAVPGGKIRVVDEETEAITLHARTARHVMVHVYTTLANDERELFLEQVLSERTKEEFYERGLDPGMAFDELKRRERDVLRLFNTMPYGEGTPGVFMKTLGPNVFRLAPDRARHAHLPWVFMDVVVEHGQWRLRWFG